MRSVLSPRERMALVALVAAGLILRAALILWGSQHYDADQYGFHPDEPKLVRYIDDFPESLRTKHDYRYPTLLPIVYGALWSAVRVPLGLSDPEPSLPGTESYEAALLFARGLNVLVFGIGSLVLTWALTRRLFGPGPALGSVAALNLMGLPLTSTALVQPDVPAAVMLLLVFHRLAGLRPGAGLRDGRAVPVGIALGAATAIKYTAAIGLVAVVVVAAARASGVQSAVRFVAVALFAALATFLVGVPGAVYDAANFAESIAYEYDSKILQTRFSARSVTNAIEQCTPAWLFVAVSGGAVLALLRRRSSPLLAILACMAVYLAITGRAFKPDYAVLFFPVAAAFAGLCLWSVSRLPPRAMATSVVVLYLALGHAWSAWVVRQAYAADTHYLVQDWLEQNVPPGPVGEGPTATPREVYIQEPRGYRFVSVHGKPTWIVLTQRRSVHAMAPIRRPERYRERSERVDRGVPISLEPGKRRLWNLRERDFRFYEDVLLGMRREYCYELAASFEPLDLPLDHHGQIVKIFRRTPCE